MRYSKSNSNNSYKVLKAHITPIGFVEVFLHEESKDLYEFLKRKEEINRLKELNHLGIMKYVWESSHHSRWEYIILMLYLIDTLAKSGDKVHLSAKVKIENNIIISSSFEFLKCLVLLLNIGHMPWTFAAEKALLMLLNSDVHIFKIFKRFFKDEPNEIREYMEQSIKMGNIYEFHLFLALLRLKHILKARDSKWIKILRTYILHKSSENSERITHKLQELLSILKQIRFISYFTLDSFFTPAPIIIDIRKLLSNKKLFLDYILSFNNTEANPLEALSTIFYENIYLNSDVLSESAFREKCLYKKLKNATRTIKKKKELQNILDSLFKGIYQEECEKIEKPQYNNLLRILIKPSYLKELPYINPVKEQINFLKRSKSGIYPTIWVAPTKDKFLVWQTLAVNKNQNKQLVKLGFEFLMLFHRNFKKWISNGFLRKLYLEVFKDYFDLSLEKFILQACELLIGEYNFEIKNKIKGEIPACLFGAFSDVKNLFETIEKDLNTKERDKNYDFIQEILAKKHLVLEVLHREIKRRYSLITISNILVKDKQSKNDICEFDGLILTRVNKKRLLLYIIEIKSRNQRGKAVGELEKKLQKINLLSDIQKVDTSINSIKIRIAFSKTYYDLE